MKHENLICIWRTTMSAIPNAQCLQIDFLLLLLLFCRKRKNKERLFLKPIVAVPMLVTLASSKPGASLRLDS